MLVTLSCIAFGSLDSDAQALDQGGWESRHHCASDLFQKLPPLIGWFLSDLFQKLPPLIELFVSDLFQKFTPFDWTVCV